MFGDVIAFFRFMILIFVLKDVECLLYRILYWNVLVNNILPVLQMTIEMQEQYCLETTTIYDKSEIKFCMLPWVIYLHHEFREKKCHRVTILHLVLPLRSPRVLNDTSTQTKSVTCLYLIQ